MKTIGIFGTSGFARELDDIVFALGWQAIFVARDEVQLASWTRADEVILEKDVLRHKEIPFVIGVGDPAAKQGVWHRFAQELRFENLIHPTATFGRHQRQAVDNERGIVVAAGARLMNEVRVGAFSVFDLNVTVGHDTVVGAFAHLAPGATVSGNVDVGERCWIGAGAVVNQGKPGRKLLIGADTIIGSGAVVVSDCDASSVYVGVPARKIERSARSVANEEGLP